MKLYEINQQILDCIDMETGEIIDVEKLEQLNLEKDVKIDGIISYIKHLNAESKAIKDEIDSLTKRMKSISNKSESLENFLKMSLAGDTFSSARHKISYRKSSSIEIIDFDSIPDDFIVIKTTKSADKTAIKNHLKNGKFVAGIELVEKQNMQIN